MSLDTRIAAFCEYVIRPMSEDWRIIIQELKSLNIGITQQTIKEVTVALGRWHVLLEIIRGGSYIAVTWIICETLKCLLPRL